MIHQNPPKGKYFSLLDCAPVILLLVAVWLRFHALGQDARLHPDEALYNTFARDAVIKGHWMLPGLLDKPPLSIYANALSMNLFGVTVNENGVLDFRNVRVGEFAGRVPNTFASILLVTVTYSLLRSLYKHTKEKNVTAILAMFLMTFSPFAIAFSATAFTDVFMTLFCVIALWMTVRNQWAWAGLYMALGFASKQPAVLYLPLIFALGWSFNGVKWRSIIRFGVIFGIGVVLLVTWDLARNQPTIWEVSSGRENYPMRFVDWSEIGTRFKIWLDYWAAILGTPWLAVIVWAGGFHVMRIVMTRREGRPIAQAFRIDGLILAYIVVYGVAHWLIAFNTFDRYLLPIVPLVAISVAATLAPIVQYTRKIAAPPERRLITLPIFLIILASYTFMLVSETWKAFDGQIKVGGDLGEHEGIDDLATFLNSKPVATIIYDHWLGWELGYYLGAWNDKRRTYYPTPEALVEDALLLDETGPRYFPMPTDQPVDDWLEALKNAGFEVSRVYESKRFVVYELIPPTDAKDA